MQVSSKLFNQQQMSQFSEINSDIQNLQSKISSGKNILAASDNPIGSVELSGMKTVKGQLDQFIKNTDNSKSRLLSVDANLENLTAIMIRANELMIQGSSDVLGPSDRQAIAIEINEMKKEALGIANQQDSSGAYFFSGYKTKIKPFTEDINGLVKYNGDRGVSSLAISESMMVETTLDGGSVFGNVKNNTGKAISIFSMLENMSYSLGTAAQAVEAAEAPTNAEIQLTNNNLGTWKFDITGNGGTASISVELSGDDPSDLINQINIANIGITASLSDTAGKIKLTSTQEGLIKINNLEIEGISGAQETPSSFITLNVTDPSGNIMGKSQTLYDTNQLATSQLDIISDSQLHIANFRGKVGARLNLLDRHAEALSIRDISIQKDISKLNDADLAELVTNLQSMLTSLQAGQQAFVKISNLNLFEFIR
jgi:flagellar hook-associated protein 3 FlgL